jgi:hypothetical protein
MIGKWFARVVSGKYQKKYFPLIPATKLDRETGDGKRTKGAGLKSAPLIVMIE